MESRIQQTINEWAADNSEATGKNNDNLAAKYAHIRGWGIDADPDNEPNYPIKQWNGDDYIRLGYNRPVQQTLDEEVLHSNERPSVTAVFGTPNPPKGLSGQLRRHAFTYSEGNWKHWLTLLLADRVDMAEGVIDDLKNGYLPNIPAERGWGAAWKYDRKNAVKNVAICGVVTLALVMLATRKRHK